MRSWIRAHPLAFAVIGSLLAIVCTAVLDAAGLSGVNALPLIPLFVLYWYLQRLSRAEIGLVWGRPRHYGLALFYPALVLALVGLFAWTSGAVSVAATDWTHTWVMLVSSLLITIPRGNRH